MYKFASLRWAAALWIFVLFSLAMAPLSVKQYLHTVGHWHSAGHSLAFFVTALFLLWNARGLNSEWRRFIVAVSLAFLMELLENIVYHAPFEWYDILFDLTGIVTAWVLTSVIRSGRPEDHELDAVSRQPTKIR